MKNLRVLYSVLLMVSIGLSFIFYYQYQLKQEVAEEYQKLSEYTDQALQKIGAELVLKRNELSDARVQITKLDETIAALGKEKSKFASELEALRTERETLKNRLAMLAEEKAAMEKKLVSLEEKFRSISELKKAIKIARIEQYKKWQQEKQKLLLAKIEMLQKLDELALQYGNKGYLVKNGQVTFKAARIRVELEPIESVTSK